MKSELSFSLSGLAVKGRRPEERLLLGQVAQTEACATLLGNLPTNQVPAELDYGSMDGCPVPLRSSVVRVVFFKLAATGVVAALVAAASDSKRVWFPCALSAAVNLVAAIHYMLIWKIRAQNMPQSHLHWASARSKDGSFVGNLGADEGQKKLEAARMFAQELAVDGLRCATPRAPPLCPKLSGLYSYHLRAARRQIYGLVGTLRKSPRDPPCTHPPPTHARGDVRRNNPGGASCFFGG
jgi:hypothetical protein